MRRGVGLAGVVSLLAVAVQAVLGEEETLMLIELARHGTRIPFDVEVSTLPDWTKQYPKTEVTGVGLRQHFNLGREIAKKFPQMFNDKFRRDEIFVRSTRTQRTQGSATAHLMGMMDLFSFEPLPFMPDDTRCLPPYTTMDMKTFAFSTGLPKGYTPVPIYSSAVDQEDLLVELAKGPCPVGHQRFEDLLNEYKAKLQTNDKFINLTKEASKLGGVDYDKHDDKFLIIEDISDFIGLDWRNNPQPVIPRSSPLYGPIRRVIDFFCTFPMMDPVLNKVLVAPLFLELSSRFNKRVKGTEYSPRYIYFSTHDTVLGPMLHTLEQLSADCYWKDLQNADNHTYCGVFPDTASSLIFELFKNSSGTFVRFYYNLNQQDLWGKSDLSLAEFDQKVAEKVDRGYKAYCTGKTEPSPSKPASTSSGGVWRILGITCLAVFILELVGGVVYFFYLKGKASSGEAPLSNKNSYLEVEDVLSASREDCNSS